MAPMGAPCGARPSPPSVRSMATERLGQRRMRDNLEAGGTAIGGWLSLRDPFVAEVSAGVGFDYVVVDMQHGLAGLGDTQAQLAALAGGAGTPVVRVPWNEPGIIGRVLDAGALGVIIPMVNSREEAEAAVAACRYAPRGRRSFGPVVAATRLGGRYFASADAEVLCIPMIETVDAVERLDDILSVPGIDAIYVGPADLSITLGLPPRPDHTGTEHAEVFDAMLERIVDGCRRHGVVPGIHASSALAAARHRQGFRMITAGFDIAPMVAGMHGDLAAARRGTSE